MVGVASNAVADKGRRCRSDSRRQRETIKLAHRGDREFTERKRGKRSSGVS